MSTGPFGSFGCTEEPNYYTKTVELLFSSPYSRVKSEKRICDEIGVLTTSEHNRILRKSDIIIAFDGYLLNTNKVGSDLLTYILDQYIDHGPNFPKSFRGSFQIVIIDNYGTEKQSCHLYIDHNASRPIFYTVQDNRLFFGPQFSSVAAHLKKKTINWASVLQFLLGGYFFGGTTAFNEVKILPGGGYLRFSNNDFEVKKYSKYFFKDSQKFEKDSALVEVSEALKDAILKSWIQADEPAVLLSGGYDSRYILYTIAEAVPDTSAITTVTWGRDLAIEASDGHIANQIAKYFGTKHITYEKEPNKAYDDFHQMLDAHSCMTDNVLYHSGEMNICKDLRETHGIRSLFRGEECFGWDRRVFNNQNALHVLGMSLPEYFDEIELCFSDSIREYVISEYKNELESIIPSNVTSYNQLKDILYHDHRLTMALQPTNYYKYHYQEIYNPLIDQNVLSCVCRLPDTQRVHKKMFRECMAHNYNHNFPFAKFTNLANWSQELHASAKLRSQVSSTLLKNHDNIFNQSYIEKLLDSLEGQNTIHTRSIAFKDLLNRMKPMIPVMVKKSIKYIQGIPPARFEINKEHLLMRLSILSLLLRSNESGWISDSDVT